VSVTYFKMKNANNFIIKYFRFKNQFIF